MTMIIMELELPSALDGDLKEKYKSNARPQSHSLLSYTCGIITVIMTLFINHNLMN